MQTIEILHDTRIISEIYGDLRRFTFVYFGLLVACEIISRLESGF